MAGADELRIPQVIQTFLGQSARRRVCGGIIGNRLIALPHRI
ncbi:hypothetical protein [Mycolicibacter hiberniae]|nr:hypothetical protein [Mycolicibacter hiberniae]